MSSRTIAIGDIHGCSTALSALLHVIDPQPGDTMVTLGDYIDRGIDSKGVLDLLIDMEKRCCLVPLMGNHEEMMLGAREGKSDFQFWLNCGGDSALDSYGSSGRLSLIPREHFAFVERCRLFHETETHIFAHANYRPDQPMDKQDRHTLLWLALEEYPPGPHCSGKIAIVAHTPQRDGDILDMGHVKCIDTGCCTGGWQVDEKGRVR